MRRILLGLLGLAIASQAGAAGPVLTVNGMPIAEADLAVAQRVVRLQARDQNVDEQTVLRRAVDQVIGHALLLGLAKQAGISVTPEEVEASVAEQESRVHDQAGFHAALVQAGVSEQDLKRLEAERMLVARYIETRVAPTISVSAEEVEAFYEQHPEQFKHGNQIRIRMILVEPADAGADGDVAAKQKAEAVLGRLKAGEDFAKLATEVSDDPTRSVGGEVGWVQKGLLLPSLEPAVFALEDGGVTGVLRSRYGYHIFQVEEHRGPGTYSLEEVRGRLATMLKQRGIQEAVARIVEEQRTRASVEVLDPALKAVLQEGAAPAPAANESAPH